MSIALLYNILCNILGIKRDVPESYSTGIDYKDLILLAEEIRELKDRVAELEVWQDRHTDCHLKGEK